MKQTQARAMFPLHTLVFTPGAVEFYKKTDKKKEVQVAQVAVLVNGGAHLLVQKPNASNVLSRFAVVRTYAGESAVRKAMHAEKSSTASSAPIKEEDVKRTYEKSKHADADHCLHILAEHYGKGVDPANWDFLTTHAKNTYHYTGTKKPTKPAVAKRSVAADVKAVAGPAKTPRRTKKPTDDAQAVLTSSIGASVSSLTARKPKTATVAKGTWSKEDEQSYLILMDVIANATNSLAHLNNARLRGISSKAYEAEQKRMRTQKKK